MLSTSLKKLPKSNILSKQDILDFEAEHGQPKLLRLALFAFRSDWSKHLARSRCYMRNLDENGGSTKSGWSREALEFLIHERHVKAVVMSNWCDAGIPAAEHGLVWILPLGTKYLPSWSLEPSGPSSSLQIALIFYLVSFLIRAVYYILYILLANLNICFLLLYLFPHYIKHSKAKKGIFVIILPMFWDVNEPM